MKHSHDVIVIGAGAAGLTAAGGCTRLGLRTALVERGAMGGECLNTGCVPSKALIAAAGVAQVIRSGGKGVAASAPQVDFASVRAHVHAAIAAIAPHDSQARFTAMGVEVIRGSARFVDEVTIDVEGRRLTASRIVLATGSRPAVPAIQGLDAAPYLTNETVFDLAELPGRLIVIGGGAVGLELGQAFRRLGSEVTIIEGDRLLPHDDPEAVEVVLGRLSREGVNVRVGVAATRVTGNSGDVRVELAAGDAVAGTHLLIAAGRKPSVEALNLEAAGVEVGPDGVRVDGRRRTTNRRIYAIGDCREGPRLTHAAGYEGALVVAEMLGLKSRAKYATLPWVTFTDPELAQVGLTEAAARMRGGRVDVFREPLSQNDRTLAEGRCEGFLKVVRLDGRVGGATIVGSAAGELVLPWSLVIAGRATAWTLAYMVVPYPTRSEASKAAAFQMFEERIFNGWTRRLAKLLAVVRG